jgi:hypothetical protein
LVRKKLQGAHQTNPLFIRLRGKKCVPSARQRGLLLFCSYFNHIQSLVDAYALMQEVDDFKFTSSHVFLLFFYKKSRAIPTYYEVYNYGTWLVAKGSNITSSALRNLIFLLSSFWITAELTQKKESQTICYHEALTNQQCRILKLSLEA